MESKNLMTTAEVAEYLRLSIVTLKTWRAQGTGPRWLRIGEMKGSPIRYERSDVDEWIEAGSDRAS